MTLGWKLHSHIAIFFLVFAYKANIIKIMTKKKSLLGPWEMQFFAWVQFEKKEEVRTGDLVKAMDLSPKQEADLL